MATSIWAATGVTPSATDRIPVDTGAAGSASRWTGQQVADAAGFIGRTHNALGSINSATAINLANGTYVSATITGSLTFSITNPPASPNGCEFTLVLTNGGSATIAWPGSVSWAGGTAPTLTASGVNVLHFATGNGGTNWYGWAELDETYGNVVGPGSSTDNAIVRFDSTTGKLVQNSVVTIDDAGRITTAEDLIARNIAATSTLYVGSGVVYANTGGNNGSLNLYASTSGSSFGAYLTLYGRDAANRASFVLSGSSTQGGDGAPGASIVRGAPAWSSASTNLVGGTLEISGGPGASASSGLATGGGVYLDGGQGYGTGKDGNILVGNTRGKLQLKAYAVASLGAATPAGMRSFANDANATTFNSVVAGGGSNFVPVFSDGTDWRIG